MKRFVTNSLILIFFSLLKSMPFLAQFYDNQWVFGYNENINNKFGLSMLDFNGEEVKLSYYGPVQEKDYHLNSTGSFICDADGYLALHSNNCSVYKVSGTGRWSRVSGK